MAAAGALAVSSAFAEPAPQPPSGLMFKDVPGDAGHALDLDWERSPDDTSGGGLVRGYVLLRANSLSGPWAAIDSTPAGTTHLRDATARTDVPYFYRVVAVGPGGRTPAGAAAGPAVARAVWYLTRWAALGALLLVVVLVRLAFALRARLAARRSGGAPGPA